MCAADQRPAPERRRRRPSQLVSNSAHALTDVCLAFVGERFPKVQQAQRAAPPLIFPSRAFPISFVPQSRPAAAGQSQRIRGRGEQVFGAATWKYRSGEPANWRQRVLSSPALGPRRAARSKFRAASKSIQRTHRRPPNRLEAMQREKRQREFFCLQFWATIRVLLSQANISRRSNKTATNARVPIHAAAARFADSTLDPAARANQNCGQI